MIIILISTQSCHTLIKHYSIDILNAGTWKELMSDNIMCFWLIWWWCWVAKHKYVLYCIPRVTLMDAYSTDYYDISYPGLIMKVNKISWYEIVEMKFWRASSTFWGKVGNKLLPAALAELASRLQRPQARHTDNNFAKEFRLQNKLWKKLL